MEQVRKSVSVGESGGQGVSQRFKKSDSWGVSRVTLITEVSVIGNVTIESVSVWMSVSQGVSYLRYTLGWSHNHGISQSRQNRSF